MFVKEETELNFPWPDGSTTRDHLTKVAKQTGKPHPRLERKLEAGGTFLYDCWKHISVTRQEAFKPITYTEMLSWSTLIGVKLEPQVVEAILVIDRVFINTCSEIRQSQQEK